MNPQESHSTRHASAHGSAAPRGLQLDPAARVAPLECLDRLPVVLAGTGLGKTSLYSLIQKGSFPAPVSIGARAVAWRRSDWQAWVNTREAAR